MFDSSPHVPHGAQVWAHGQQQQQRPQQPQPQLHEQPRTQRRQQKQQHRTCQALPGTARCALLCCSHPYTPWCCTVCMCLVFLCLPLLLLLLFPAAAAAVINDVRTRGESCGGVVTCVVRGCPKGLGAPVFDKLEAELAKAMLSLPATKVCMCVC